MPGLITVPSRRPSRLTESQPYFDSQLAGGVTGATVFVESSEGNKFDFVDQGNGDYVWTPTTDGEIGAVGTGYMLTIVWNGDTYTSATQLNRVPVVDSITTVFEEDLFGQPDGFYAEFFARDFVGEGDTYWIKTFKNGTFLNKPAEINLAFDAGFAPGSAVDGLIFIPPIRETVNRISDDDGPDDSDVAPWAEGDTVRVEIHSISFEAWEFMSIAQEQMINGENSIFAVPLANTRGNVKNATTDERVLGIFNVAAVEGSERMVE